MKEMMWVAATGYDGEVCLLGPMNPIDDIAETLDNERMLADAICKLKTSPLWRDYKDQVLELLFITPPKSE